MRGDFSVCGGPIKMGGPSVCRLLRVLVCGRSLYVGVFVCLDYGVLICIWGSLGFEVLVCGGSYCVKGPSVCTGS